MMEFDLKMSDILVEMMRTESGSKVSSVATFDVQLRPSTFEPVEMVQSDHIDRMPETTKDSTSGRSALVGRDKPTHNHE